MQTRYKIDSYQPSYFVIDSFQQLFDVTAPDFTPLYQQLRTLPELQAGQILANDSLITV
jgi:phenylalanine-4-hydroxylase